MTAPTNVLAALRPLDAQTPANQEWRRLFGGSWDEPVAYIHLLAPLLGMQPTNEAQGLFERGVKIPARFLVRSPLTRTRKKHFVLIFSLERVGPP